MKTRVSFSAFCLVVYCAVVFCTAAPALQAATYRTKNFVVTAQSPAVAEKMAKRAEFLREDLARFWLGKPLPNWFKRCSIKIVLNNGEPGGQTNFIFNRGEVYGWDMEAYGSEDGIYESVLPHEITHTILASYFRTPVPRWADEGAATFTEGPSERAKYQNMLQKFLRNKQGIPIDQLMLMTEYPKNPLPLYAQGSSLAEFMIRQRGPLVFVLFVEQSMKEGASLTALVREHYGYESMRALHNDWVAWVSDGMPAFLGTNLKQENDRAAVAAVVSNYPPASAATSAASATETKTAEPTGTPVEGTANVTYANGEAPTVQLPRPKANLIYRTPDMRQIKDGKGSF